MISVVHGVAWFDGHAETQILKLMKDQSSCARAAYQSIHKHEKTTRKDVYAHLSPKYSNRLKAIQIYDAIDRIKGLKSDGVIFGGKKAWDNIRFGKISNDEWKTTRDSRYYASGDTRNSGNRSVRFKDGRILISSGSGFRSYISGKIWFPKKFRKIDFSHCYNINLVYKDGKFKVTIGSNAPDVPLKSNLYEGVIGVDTNPDGLGVTEVNGTGNILSHCYLASDRLKFASTNKRQNDIRLISKELIDLAIKKNKSIAIETLKFGKIKFIGRKWNRIRANFVYSKFIEAIKSRASKFGIPVKEVNSAYTSKLGKLKYKNMFSLSNHESAALVIARRSQGCLERQTFSASRVERAVDKNPKRTSQTNSNSTSRKGKKPNLEQVKLAGRGLGMTVSESSWEWLQSFLKPNPSSLDPSRHRVQNPARGSASNRDNRDIQQVSHVVVNSNVRG